MYTILLHDHNYNNKSCNANFTDIHGYSIQYITRLQVTVCLDVKRYKSTLLLN